MKYLIKSEHNVYEDSYEYGEGEHVNSYPKQEMVEANSIKEAITYYIYHILYYNSCNYYIYDEEPNIAYCSFLVDIDNYEASPNEIKEWEQGKNQIFSNRVEITISKVIPITNLLEETL